MKLFSKVVAATALIAAAQVNAEIIDFGSAPWTPGADGLTSYTVGNVTAEAGPKGKLLFAADSADGLGVRGGEEDEVDHSEALYIKFASAIKVHTVLLTDFFPKVHPAESADGVTDDGSLPSGEYGHINLWLGGVKVVPTIDVFGSNSVGGNGEQLVALGGLLVDKITFWTGGSNDEFSVKSITVPEPGLLGLLGLGMVCLGLSRRRQAKAA